MRLLLDTHIIIWTVLGDRRLSVAQRSAIESPGNALLVSPVVAYELTHLQVTGRLPLDEPIDRLQQLIGFELVDLPYDCWRKVKQIPDIHRDPIDRLLIAHALSRDMRIITADANIRRYPVTCI